GMAVFIGWPLPFILMYYSKARLGDTALQTEQLYEKTMAKLSPLYFGSFTLLYLTGFIFPGIHYYFHQAWPPAQFPVAPLAMAAKVILGFFTMLVVLYILYLIRPPIEEIMKKWQADGSLDAALKRDLA